MKTLARGGRFVAILAGLAAIGYGLTLPATGSQGRWLACLALGSLLTGIGLWPRKNPLTTPESRPVVNVAASIALIFAMLGVQMARVQVISSDAIAEHRGADPITGDVLGNPRTLQDDLLVRRGSILDRNGVVLAKSVLADGVMSRVYPVASASYVCGYFSPLKFGTAGLEAEYDAQLSGKDSSNPIKDEFNDLIGRSPSGSDLQLTIDASLQTQAHDLLGDRIGSIVVIDIETGQVLVLASNPTYDPDQLVAVDAESAAAAETYWAQLNADPTQPLLVRSTGGLYTPGSTFKTITAAAAIERGESGPDTIYTDDGSLDIDGRVLIEENRPDDTIDRWTMREGIAYSLNVVFAQIGLQLGGSTLWNYAERFGFGDAIPFDVPVAKGQIATSSDFLDSDTALADTAFGQGELLTTPLGMALVASGLANGGAIMQPYLVESVIGANGDIFERTEPHVWRTPVSAETANQVRDMMINAVENGYSQRAIIPGYVVGGKTGTAETGSGEPHAWFIGFAGETEPRFAVAVVLEHGGSGTADSLDIARGILTATLAAYPE